MYKTIYVPVDNSDHSNMALDVGVSLAKTFGSKLVGSHVYAAKMHDKRFKQMEAGLPEEYHDENELERQRQIHDSLITRGLQIITDSYLDIVDQKTAQANIPVERKSLEGRNFKVLVEDINTNAYDLVIMGALGVGAVKDSVIGGVTERVVRRVRTSDMLIIKNTLPMNGGAIVVAVDGSHLSFGGLKTALALGKASLLAFDFFAPRAGFALEVLPQLDELFFAGDEGTLPEVLRFALGFGDEPLARLLLDESISRAVREKGEDG